MSKAVEDLTVEDLKNMPASELGRLVEEACLKLSHVQLREGIEALIADPEKGLDDLSMTTIKPPFPTPVGKLKGRADLGNIGINIEIRHSLVNIDYLLNTAYGDNNDVG